jgi:hypothetical protein
LNDQQENGVARDGWPLNGGRRDVAHVSFIVSVCGYAACSMHMQAFCSIATEVFGYAAVWLWAAFEPHTFQTRICAHFDA